MNLPCLKLSGLLTAVVAATFSHSLVQAIENIHSSVSLCVKNENSTCLSSCKYCHGEPWLPIDIYNLEVGDLYLCIKCHDTRDTFPIEKNITCLSRVHKENIDYIKGSHSLKNKPHDIRLFCDIEGIHCKLYCISCHKPMRPAVNKIFSKPIFSQCNRCHIIGSENVNK